MSGEVREIAVLALAFAFGAAIGSFLNVVIYRLPREDEGLSVIRPRGSFCPSCRAPIAWYDNIPLLSYFALLGKCRRCGSKIPLRYFVVELATASLFALLARQLLVAPGGGGGLASENAALFAVQAALLAALVAITFIDIDFRIIPDKIDIPGILLAAPLGALVPALHAGRGDLEALGIGVLDPAAQPRLYAAAAALLGVAVGGGAIWAIGALGSIVFRKEAMGFGDVKLLAMIGGYVGWKGALLALLIACLIGSVVGIVVRLLTRDPYIPFGPFLSAGAVVMVFWYSEAVRFLLETLPDLVWVR